MRGGLRGLRQMRAIKFNIYRYRGEDRQVAICGGLRAAWRPSDCVGHPWTAKLARRPPAKTAISWGLAVFGKVQ
mgnify:CR=1 FL=1